MSLPVVLRPEASRDVEEARDYLEAQRAGLGQVFVDQLNATLTHLAVTPEMYGIVWKNVRAILPRQFTFVVYYRVHSDRVEVLAVMHGSRDPSAWQART